MKMPKGALFLVIILIAISTDLAYTQDVPGTAKEEPGKYNLEGARPDIPGEIGFDYGFVMAPDMPDEIAIRFWPSFYFRGFYKWNLPLGNSKFSFNPGISIASEKYTFKDTVTIASVLGDNGYETQVVGLSSILGSEDVFIRSQLIPIYFGIPIEFTLITNKELPRKGFKFTFGVNVDLRIDAKTKIKFEEDGRNKKIKEKGKYDLSWYRINLTGKFGYGSIALFYNYSLTPLFEGNKGPLGTTAQPMSFGISLDIF
jgi:hypothetical protein